MYKKFFIIIVVLVISISNIFASTLLNIDEYKEQDQNYLLKTYEVKTEDENIFVKNIDKKIFYYNKQYEFIDMKKSGGAKELTEDISINKDIVNYYDNGKFSITNLPEKINYIENGYNGYLDLNHNSINNYKKDDSNKYYITATYTGRLTKVLNNPYIYELKYKKINEIPITPMVVIGTIIFIFVIYILKNNVEIYNMQYGKWVLIGKMRINKPFIDISKLNYNVISNYYKIELSKNLTKKLYNKILSIKNNSRIKDKLVDEINNKFIFEIEI